jgi:serine/threonine protein kinase
MSSLDPLIGRKLGDYTIKNLLGRGGMSRVYRGYDENLDRYAAVKVISGDFATTTEEEYTRRFQIEARAIARLRHPNIVGIYQFGRTEGIYYMAMVFLEGRDLRLLLKEYAEKGQRIPAPEMMRIVRDVASALDYAHEQGVIHRDIKPSNIMLEKNAGRALLMDFGLALSVSEGTMGDTFGSAHYIAPEQAVSSAKAVPQSDLYSLGIVIYEMLAGKVPFDDPSAMSVALKHLNEVPPPITMYNPDLPPAVERVIMRALDKDPNRRYATGMEFVAALDEALAIVPLASELTPSRPSAPMPKVPPFEAPHPPSDPPERGLAGRLARRKTVRKDEEAKPLDEASLQIDDDTLNMLLDRMSDPSDIGLGKQGIGLGPMVTESVFDTRSVPQKQEPKRRSRVGLLLVMILATVIIGGGLWLGLKPGNKDDGDTTAPGGVGTAETEVAVAALTTEEATESAVLPVETEVAVPTEEATNEVILPVVTSEATEEIAATEASATETATVRPSRTPSRTPQASDTPEETDTPTLTVSPTGEESVTPEAADIRLLYTDSQFWLINISGQMINISNLVFEQRLPAGEILQFEAATWDEHQVLQPTSRMETNACYQIVAGRASRESIGRDVCLRYLGWYGASIPSRYFWISSDPNQTFTVRWLGDATPIASCTVGVGECRFNLPPE